MSGNDAGPSAGHAGPRPILTRAPFFAVLGVVSAAFGAALSLAGWAMISRIRGRSVDRGAG